MPRTLVTSALPYANGPIHFGHIAGAYLPADIYVRWLRARGEDVRYICGTDEYGVAITVRAEEEGVSYREYVDRWHDEIRGTFEAMRIEFDIFSGTARCPHHTETAQAFFLRLHSAGFLEEVTERQHYCDDCDRFLPDRYVEGTCPQCGGSARGDECKECGNWLDALELAEPRCAACRAVPDVRETTHFHLDLGAIRDRYLADWYDGKSDREHLPWKSNVDTFVRTMLKDLTSRPITRDLRWGVPIPAEVGATQGKVLYVWFDAPIGYVSATKEWAEQQGTPEAWKDYWLDPDTRLVHFIGKDNIAFHVVVFPSMLWGQSQGEGGEPFVLPWAVPANEFYNLQGKKFSTSDGWSIDLNRFFAEHSVDVLRFHLTLTSPETADAEFTWEGFQNTNNELLADKVGNFASRVLKFVQKRFDGKVPAGGEPPESPELAEASAAFAAIGDSIAEQRFKAAAQSLIAACGALNRFFDAQAPWKLIKGSDAEQARCSAVLERCIAYLELLSRRIAPFCPTSAEQLRGMLGVDGDPDWGEESETVPPVGLPAGHPLGEPTVLFPKLEDETVAAELARLRESESTETV